MRVTIERASEFSQLGCSPAQWIFSNDRALLESTEASTVGANLMKCDIEVVLRISGGSKRVCRIGTQNLQQTMRCSQQQQ